MFARWLIRLGALALCVVAVLPAACTGESSFLLPALDAGAPDGRYEDVCASWARRECASEDACHVGIFFRWENDDQCIQRQTLTCELEASDPDVPFDPSLVDACMFPADCSRALGTLSAPNSPPFACRPAKRRMARRASGTAPARAATALTRTTWTT